ncbi:hypothetical protein A2774_01570 [Candidatus Roizmanbacteria bacterium RIFCSPHIGHO2_01_FULL_39_12c]|uniref:DUF11 domain-containing protein n=1 Tax=Candidatus Roizmanbacteria bacterium RIFCSPHIGHO2_01_FULL_39_12c TaxID=1802031 RepID=A0A1F7G874_9BACT|nr:MAG: hypothetical protein A2774_01570 [Candidatus Roizmanbacteria bacterium RIFCSPHIGHO2_01_FULL_39_12c]OGK46592.1 MAG: hypothetical protein A2963_02575 [Candidatus Roizmanbacteria bacterium RIFCSPLOWO2_01_FULL_40_13]
MKGLTTTLLLTISFLLLVSPVSGQYGQYGPYQGPEPGLSIMIDKMVGKPVETKGGSSDSDFVDNLSPSDDRFSPDDEVLFKLKVKNTSEAKLKDVTVKDFLPDFVEPVGGPGTFSDESREITIDAGDLEVDEEKVFIIKVKVLNQDRLPEDQGLMCVVNKSEAFNDSAADEDTAQFCIEKEVLGITEVPSAGPELGLALLIAQFSALGTGLFLKKKFS